MDVNPNCKGELNWQKEFSGYQEKNLENRLLLYSSDRIIIDNISEILCLDIAGNLLWKRDKWYGSQIIIRDNLVYYTSSSRKDRMEAVTLDNKLAVEDFIIYDIIKESYLVLFEPYKKDFYAQAQYTAVMEVNSGKFIIYKTGTKIPGYEWSKIFFDEICPLIPLINFEKEFLLTASHSDVMLFDINTNKEDAEPKISFPLPTQSENIFVSSSKEGNLFFGYSEDDKIFLKCYDPEGKELYSIQVQEEFANVNKVIAPPILAEDLVYLLTKNKLICSSNGEVKWITSSEGLSFSYATALADNSILVAQGNLLKHFNSDSRQIFMYEANDTISAPPVVDKSGIVFFCTKTNLYSLK
jgi:outer membrane protein assembly factor BamB